MTISNTANKIFYEGRADEAKTDFPITFPFIEPSDICVAIIDPDGFVTVLEKDYFIDTVTCSVRYPGYPGGQAPPIDEQPAKLGPGYKLYIYRNIPINQLNSLGDKYPMPTLEEMVDKLTMIIQDIKEQVDRSIKGNISSSSDNDIAAEFQQYIQRALAAAGSAEEAAAIAAELLERVKDYSYDNIACTMADLQAGLEKKVGIPNSNDPYKAGSGAGNIPILDSNAKLPVNHVPIATETQVGGVKVGGGLTVDAEGILRSTLSGSQMPIGTVYYAVRTDVPEGSLRLDGTEYTRSFLPDFYDNYILTGRVSTCSYSQYSLEASRNKGNVGKIAVDTANRKFKMPRFEDGTFIAQAVTAAKNGQYNQDQIVNIKGVSGAARDDYAPSPSGAFYTESSSAGYEAGNGNSWRYSICFDASKVVNTGDKVQPRHIQYPFFMVVANAVVPASQSNYDAFVNNLSLKANADLGNIPSNIDYVVDAWQLGDSWYRVYKSGWIEQGGTVLANAGSTNISVSLHKEFTRTNYKVMLTKSGDYSGTDAGAPYCRNKFVSNFILNKTTANYGCDWYACGY